MPADLWRKMRHRLPRVMKQLFLNQKATIQECVQQKQQEVIASETAEKYNRK